MALLATPGGVVHDEHDLAFGGKARAFRTLERIRLPAFDTSRTPSRLRHSSIRNFMPDVERPCAISMVPMRAAYEVDARVEVSPWRKEPPSR